MQLVCLVLRVSLVTMVAQETQVLLDNPEPQVLKDKKVNKAAKDLLDLSDSLDPKARLETVVFLVFLALSALLVLADYVDRL